jgi:hypothetical protein
MNLRGCLGQVAISAFVLTILSSAGVRPLSAQNGDPQELSHAFPRDGATMILDNAVGTAWDVTWTPGKPTLMHRHKFDYVDVELTDSTVEVTAQDGSRRTSALATGRSYFFSRGTTHIEEVPGTSPVRHAIVIDLKDLKTPESANSTTATTAVLIESAKKLVENDRVTIWDFTWPSLQSATTVVLPKGAFIIFLGGGELTSSNSPYKPGQVLFTTDGHVFSELSTKGHVRGIVVQLK